MDWQTEMYTQITRIHQVTKAKIRAEVGGKSFENSEAQTEEKVCTQTDFRELKEKCKRFEIELRLMTKEKIKFEEELHAASSKIRALSEAQVSSVPVGDVKDLEAFMRVQTRALEWEHSYHEILVKHNKIEADHKDCDVKIKKLEEAFAKAEFKAHQTLLA